MLALPSKAKESEDLTRMKLALPKKLKSEQLSRMHQAGMAKKSRVSERSEEPGQCGEEFKLQRQVETSARTDWHRGVSVSC
jgi:hypothetical protein